MVSGRVVVSTAWIVGLVTSDTKVYTGPGVFSEGFMVSGREVVSMLTSS